MKLFIKILLFVFVAFVTNVKVASATITFSNIQETTTSFSFQNETPKTIYKVIENDLANCCQNGNDLVDYRNRGERLEANATKEGTRFIADGAGNVLDTKIFQGLQEVSAVVKGGRGGTQLPLLGKPGTYANLGNGHKIVYGADGRALFDVSTSRIKGIQWNWIFHSKVHHYSAAKCTSNSGAKYTTLIGV